MSELLVSIATACLRALYHLCRLCPTRNRIVCISRQSDTPSLDFLLIKAYCSERKPPVDVVVLSKQLHNPVLYVFEMIRQVYYIATSKAVVLDSYCIVVSLMRGTIKAPVIQIWHALGNMKKAGYTALDQTSEEGRSPKVARLLHMHEGYDAIAISSLSFSEDFAAVFNADPSVLFEAPLPRTDALLSSDRRTKDRQAILDRFPQLKGKEIIVYCPTFRRSISARDTEAVQRLIDSIDFNRFGLIYKPHPVSALPIDDPRVVTIPGPEPDPLFAADFVVSDYSTVIYEAGLLGVPVFLYAYDWDSYSQKRGLNINLQKDVPTLFTSNPECIVKAIEENDFDARAYQTFTRAYVAVPQGDTCTAHICEHILAMAD